MNPKQLWRYETMFPADLAEAVRTLPIAWLPVSPLEWHGEAIALGCDALICGALCRKAWEKVGGVLLPTLFIGTGTNFVRFEEGKGPVDYWELETVTMERNPGSIYSNPITLELVLRDFLYCLNREGFKLCVVVSGHGAIEQLNVINAVCDRFNAASEKSGSIRTLFRYGIGKEIPEELRFPGAGGHADFSEASILGGVDPSLVDTSRFAVNPRDRKIGLNPENVGKIDFEKGRKCLEYSAERLAEEVRGCFAVLGK